MYHFGERQYWIQVIRTLVDFKVSIGDYNLEEIYKEVCLNKMFR